MARKRRSKLVPALVIIGLAAIAFVALAAFRAGAPPTVVLTPELPAIGKRTPIKIVVEEPKRGLSGLRVEFTQGERVEASAGAHRLVIALERLIGEQVVEK